MTDDENAADITVSETQLRNIRSANVITVQETVDITSGKATVSTSRPPAGRAHQDVSSIDEKASGDDTRFRPGALAELGAGIVAAVAIERGPAGRPMTRFRQLGFESGFGQIAYAMVVGAEPSAFGS